VVRFPAGIGNFSHHRVQTGSGAQSTSCPVGTRGSFPGGLSGRGVKLTTHIHLVPKSRMRGAVPPLSRYAFVAWCSVKEAQDNFTFNNAVRKGVSASLTLTSCNIYIKFVNRCFRETVRLPAVSDHTWSSFITNQRVIQQKRSWLMSKTFKGNINQFIARFLQARSEIYEKVHGVKPVKFATCMTLASA
jgi:hypothetical protein